MPYRSYEFDAAYTLEQVYIHLTYFRLKIQHFFCQRILLDIYCDRQMQKKVIVSLDESTVIGQKMPNYSISDGNKGINMIFKYIK